VRLIFEFGSFNKETFPQPIDLRTRLDPILATPPGGFRSSVEIRDADHVSPE
jgi:hypothetical protein